MTEDRSRRGASSTSHPRPSRPFPRSGTASSTSRSAGKPPGLGAGELRDLADRHGVAPRRSLGQNFLLDPNVARAIVRDAGIGPGDRVIEIGAGLGSLTLALDASGADVVAIELDPALVSALNDVLEGHPRVRVVRADAMRLDWDAVLGPGDDPWILCANLPYNIATPLVLDVLTRVPKVVRSVVMMQREVGERLAARPGDDAYGAVSVRAAYRPRSSGRARRSSRSSSGWTGSARRRSMSTRTACGVSSTRRSRSVGRRCGTPSGVSALARPKRMRRSPRAASPHPRVPRSCPWMTSPGWRRRSPHEVRDPSRPREAQRVPPGARPS